MVEKIEIIIQKSKNKTLNDYCRFCEIKNECKRFVGNIDDENCKKAYHKYVKFGEKLRNLK